MIDPRMVDAPWTDDRILDELNEDDQKQLERCWDRARCRHFGTLVETRMFMGTTVMAVLEKLGVTATVDEREIDRQMAENKVKVEHRMDYTMDESWRKGIYIYKNLELVAFISHPIVAGAGKSMTSRIILPGSLGRCTVWTNAHDVIDRIQLAQT